MMTTVDPEVVRKALETAAALEQAAQSAWQERSRAADLFESSRGPAIGTERSVDPREA